MLGFFKVNRWALMAVIVFVAGFLILYNRTENGNDQSQETPIGPPVTVEEASSQKVQASTTIILETYYTKCGHMVTEKAAPKPEDLKLDRQAFASNYPGWTVIDFSESEVRLKRVIDDYCPDKYYIGVEDGVIALIHGEPGSDDRIVLEKTEIPIEFLRDNDKKLLQKGIPIKDVQEFFKIREGFSN